MNKFFLSFVFFLQVSNCLGSDFPAGHISKIAGIPVTFYFGTERINTVPADFKDAQRAYNCITQRMKSSIHRHSIPTTGVISRDVFIYKNTIRVISNCVQGKIVVNEFQVPSITFE